MKKDSKHTQHTSAGSDPTLAPAQGTVIATGSPAATITPVVTPSPSPAPGLPASASAPSSAAPAPAAPPNSPSPSLSIVDAPPDTPLPAVPADFVEQPAKDFAGFRPQPAQIAIASHVVTELQGSTDYAERFGPTAPAVEIVAASVDVAHDWRVTRDAAEAFASFARTQDGLAWKDTLTLLAQLQPLFLAAVTHDPSVAAEYPALARMFSVRKANAKSALASRKKNAKASASKAAEATVTNAVNAALAHPAEGSAASMANGTATAATVDAHVATGARTVTVTG